MLPAWALPNKPALNAKPTKDLVLLVMCLISIRYLLVAMFSE
jgi:hypothetical protein